MASRVTISGKQYTIRGCHRNKNAAKRSQTRMKLQGYKSVRLHKNSDTGTTCVVTQGSKTKNKKLRGGSFAIGAKPKKRKTATRRRKTARRK